MSTITVSGILKTPTGSVLGNTLLRVRSVTSHTGTTIRYAHEDITIPANGQYNFTLLYGEYSIYVQYSGSFRLSGVISINATDVAAHPAAQYSIETLLDTFALETSSILEDVFTINGSNGTDGSNGIDGTNGTNGDTIYTQFYWSADGVDFHPTLADTDYYFRTRVVTNAVAGAWSIVTKFRPQAGVDYNTNGIDANAYATQAAQAANTAVQASDTAVDANYSIELNVTAAHNSEIIATEAATLAAQQATAATDAAVIATTKAAEAAASAEVFHPVNIGSGIGVYQENPAKTPRLKTFIAGTGVLIDNLIDVDEIVLSTSFENPDDMPDFRLLFDNGLI